MSRPLFRPGYARLSTYSPGVAPCPIDVSDNTNLFGVPPRAMAALRGLDPEAVTRYPVLYARTLRSAIARYVGARADEVTTGCGSDDVLDSIIRAFCEPGDRVAHAVPTFGMIPVFSRVNGIEPVAVPLRPDFDVDAEALLATGARVIYLCAPNNPTGTMISEGALNRVLERAPGVVVLDEAYAEFARDSSAALRHPRLIVTRTFSKAFGLAGLRVGYGIGPAELIAEVEKARGPYKVNAIAEHVAATALEQDLDWVREHVALARASRDRLAEGLRGLGIQPLPSAANFLLVPVRDSARIASAMRERGIAVRAFTALPGVGDALRLGVGPWPVMEQVLNALKEVLP